MTSFTIGSVRRLLWTSLSASLIALTSGTVTAGTGLTPLETTECAVRDGVGACREWVKTYTVQGGISCSEECQSRDGVGACRYQAKCTYDPESGCFAKEICETMSLRGCTQTRVIASCEYRVKSVQ